MIGENVKVNLGKFDQIEEVVISYRIDMVIIGPEAPLADGLTDYLQSNLPDVRIIGPGKAGARLEASKAFSKAFMQRHNIPTASYEVITGENADEGLAHIDNMSTPIVLKADGLAAGKGVLICESHEEARSALKKMLDGQFGQASHRVVIEEFLSGREYSVFILTNGTDYYLLPAAKDYKRVGEGDNGLNTGGMGAVSPVSYVDEPLMKKTVEQIIKPTLKGLREEAIPYVGFIFFGLIEVEGNPFVIEYNCRMGDPETEVVIPRIESDLLAHLKSISEQDSDRQDLITSPNACATVMLVSGGYPVSYEKGYSITGIEDVSESIVFHAGTKQDNDKLVTNGGRVLAVSSIAGSPEEAIAKSYEQIEHIKFEKQYFRTDIGFDL